MIKFKHGIKKVAAATAGLTLSLTAFAPLAYAEQDGGQGGQHRAQGHETYHSELRALNGSGVSGKAALVHQDNQLGVAIEADGLTPNQIHPQHIHGKNHPEVAFCPSTTEDDANGDGFLSVIEGAPDYGPIKLNLTNPQTEFGTPPTPALFFPFAGTPDNNNFPKADANGNISFEGEFTFDQNDPNAVAAQESLMPLEDQHIVLHGAPAPQSVDADAFEAVGLPVNEDPNAVIYDPLLPVACGEIVRDQQNTEQAPVVETPAEQQAPVTTPNRGEAAEQSAAATAQQNQNANATAANANATAAFDATMGSLSRRMVETEAVARDRFNRNMEQGMSFHAARDHFVNELQVQRDRFRDEMMEARNRHIDALNQAGDVQARDAFLAHADKAIAEFYEKSHASAKSFMDEANRS